MHVLLRTFVDSQAQSAIFCGFLRFPALPTCFLGEGQNLQKKSAKNLRSGSVSPLRFVPFKRGLSFCGTFPGSFHGETGNMNARGCSCERIRVRFRGRTRGPTCGPTRGHACWPTPGVRFRFHWLSVHCPKYHPGRNYCKIIP